MDIAPEGEGQCGTGIIFASMDNPFHTYIPEGFATVNAYLFVDTPNALITFLKNAFFAQELNRSEDKRTGEVQNVILRIGTSCFMISQARDQFLGCERRSTCTWMTWM